MKKQVVLISFNILILFVSSLFLANQHSGTPGTFKLETGTNNNHSASKQQNAEGAMQWRYDRLKDEYGNFYSSYIYDALKTADVMKSANRSGGLNLQWEELGPDNVGGRTRAILIDRRDATHNTLYAGGVSGGLWKSPDAGNSWHELPDWNKWLAVSCITQGPAPINNIYVGTGEGLATTYNGGIGFGSSFNSGSVGNGIYKLDMNDNPLRITPDNFATNWISGNDSFSWINRIAADPNDNNHLIAGTSKGLYQTFNAGNAAPIWQRISTASGGNISNGMVCDVKFANDGRNVFAAANGGNYIFKSADGGYTWNKIIESTDIGFPPLQLGAVTRGRIEIAIAPSDPNKVYLSIATGNGITYGIYKTDSANFNIHTRWSSIANRSPFFDPFPPEPNNGQGWYDNTIAVSTGDANKIYVGGVNFYTWSDETGWKLDDAGLGAGISNPYYIHPDKHTIVISETDSNTMYIGCDGGIYKSTDAISHFPYCTFSAMNRGYNVTQNYSIAAALTGEVMGGSKDNGTNYVNYLGNTPHFAQMVLGGDGTFAEFSHIDPKISFAGVYYAQTGRNGNYASPFAYTGFYDIKVDPHGRGTTGACPSSPSIGPAGITDAPFVTPFYLCETKQARDGLRTSFFTADTSYNAGEVVKVQSHTGNYRFDYTLPSALNQGSTITVPDPVRSRFFETSACGVWLTSDALNLGIVPRWYHLTGNSGISGTADAYASTPDGDILYIGTDAGRVYKFPNLNVRCDTTIYPAGTVAGVIYTNTNQYSNHIVASGRVIEGIAVDPDDTNHLAVAVAGFSAFNQPHVYESNDGGQSWFPDTVGLPDMPVYSIIIHDANTIIIGTELGIWSWNGSKWHEENNILPRVPVYRMIETELYNESCKVLYIGTHGRGMWRCTTLTSGSCNTAVGTGIHEATNNSVTGLTIFPNPVNSSSKISVNIEKTDNITLRIFDMSGKLYKEATYRNASAGENLYNLDATGLCSGNYLLAATIGANHTKSRLFIVPK